MFYETALIFLLLVSSMEGLKNSLLSSAIPPNVKHFGGGVFLRPHLWHMEIPRLGVESEL